MQNCRKCKKEMGDTPFCPYCGTKQEVDQKKTVKRRGNGQGSVFKLPSGKYRAMVTVGSWVDSNGNVHLKRRVKNFAKKSDAIAALPALMQVIEKPKDITLIELYNEFTNGKNYDTLSKSQRDKLGYAWKRLEPISLCGISTLTVHAMQTVIDDATSTYYPARDMKVLLSHLYKIAIKREIVPINKTINIELPEQPKAKRECWTTEEIEAIWNDYRTHKFTGYVLVMCYAGLRYGELAKMPLSNIHLDEHYMIGGIKTEAGIDREIPLHARIEPVIRNLINSNMTLLLQMNEDNFYNQYWEMVTRTGIRELPPHTCRHYYFSQMTAAGVQGGIIAEVGGHANYLTTLKNYVRVPLADKIAAVNTIK